ncbi:MAG: DUF998 domain-containing protein [Candidatus Bathyarchaeia archaeon]
MKLPISSLAGVAVIILYCVFTFSSWALFSTTYSPVTNWLSDLGNSSPTYNPRGAILYNLGCILTGIALFPFFIGLYKWYTDEKWRKMSLSISQAVGCLAAFALIMIGVFSEDSGSLHILWSDVFFLLNLVVLILVGASLFTHPRYIKAIAYYGFTVAAINLAFVFVSNTPLLEWFTVFTSLGYVGLITYNMAK